MAQLCQHYITLVSDRMTSSHVKTCFGSCESFSLGNPVYPGVTLESDTNKQELKVKVVQ